MSSKQLRVGVVGFGKMGLLHAGLANALPLSCLAAVSDSEAGILDTFGAVKPQVATYKNYERMLESEALDAVFITSPTHLHVPMALTCLKRRVPFFVEKPLAPRSADAIPLLEALAGNALTNMVGFMTRHIDTFRKSKEIVASGALGNLIHLRTTMYVAQLFRAGKGWRYDRETSGGGVLITQNSHLIDLLLWIFGPIDWVSGQTKSWFSRGVEDFAHAYLGFESGLTGYIDTSWSLRHHRTVDIWIDVQGAGGNLTVTDDELRLYLEDTHESYPRGWTIWKKPDLFEGVHFDIGGPEYARQDAEFLSAVRSAETVGSDAASAFCVQQVVDAIYRSAESGGKQTPVSGGWRGRN